MNNQIKSTIRGAWKALLGKNVAETLFFYADETELRWGPFTFNGLKEIEKWATELGQRIPKMGLMEKGFKVDGNKAILRFVLSVTLSNKIRGLLPGIGSYELKRGKILREEVEFLSGVVVIRRQDAKLFYTNVESSMI